MAVQNYKYNGWNPIQYETLFNVISVVTEIPRIFNSDIRNGQKRFILSRSITDDVDISFNSWSQS